MKRYPVCGCLNMRELGGIPVSTGGFTKKELFWRSDCPTQLTARDLEFIGQKEIRTVIDLRSKEECEKVPNVLKQISGLQIYELSLGEDIPTIEEGIPQSYILYAKNMEVMYQTLHHCLEDQSVWFHCGAGKDRTGVVSAILLWIAGASIEDIVADYIVSGVYIRNKIAVLKEQRPNLPPFAGQSKAIYMETFLKWIMEQYGDSRNYLKELGFQEDEILDIKAKMIAYE